MVEMFINTDTALYAHGLVLGYRRGAPVAGPLDLEVCMGELILLSGPNGSGKTTLLRTAAGLQKPLGGSLTAREAILLPTRIPKIKGFTVLEFFKVGYSSDTLDATGILERLGIADLKDRDISTLSDGQFQKVCLCPAIAAEKKLILLDEPTAFLDAETRRQLLQLLQDLATGKLTGRKVAVLISSHDLDVCRHYCTREISLEN